MITAIVAAGMMMLGIPAALAAAPSNDLFTGAKPVSAGHSELLDTTEATTDADDASMNTDCGAPATDASVWYSYTPAEDGGLIVDVSSSSYSAGVLVAVGSPGSFSLVTCGPGTVGFPTLAGITYYILAIDDGFDGGGNGGDLNISFNEAPDAPTLSVTVNRTGQFIKSTGAARLTGTITCTDADFVQLMGDVTQTVGRVGIHGEFATFLDGSACDGMPQPWTADALPDPGAKFAGGKAMAVALSFACGQFQCAVGFIDQTVQLKGGK